MDDLKQTIAKNLVALRTKAKLTQLQLAEMLNYSDKAVSKWERGVAIPDLHVLIRISEIYGVTLDDLVSGADITPETAPRRRIFSRRVFITVLSALLVWFVATGLFAILYFIPVVAEYAWLAFIVAPLPTGIVLTVFAAKWGNRITITLAVSLIIWACAVIIHIYVWAFVPGYTQIFVIYIVAAVFEVLTILWFVFRWYTSKKK